MRKWTIKEINLEIRRRYEGARYIKHHQMIGFCYNGTFATVDRMPNTNEPGRIFIGFTDILERDGVR